MKTCKWDIKRVPAYGEAPINNPLGPSADILIKSHLDAGFEFLAITPGLDNAVAENRTPMFIIFKICRRAEPDESIFVHEARNENLPNV